MLGRWASFCRQGLDAKVDRRTWDPFLLCLIFAVCSQMSHLTSLSFGFLVNKMGLTNTELLRGLREMIPTKCV